MKGHRTLFCLCLLVALFSLSQACAQGPGLSAYSSASYLAVPVSLSISEGATINSVVSGGVYTGLAYSSYRMHTARGDAWLRWEQIDLDMTTMSIAVVAADAWEPVVGKWGWISLAPLAGYHALTKQRAVITTYDPLLHPLIMTTVAFGGLVVTERWDAVLPIFLFGVAAFIRVVLDADGNQQIAHSSWHLTGAAAATVALNLDNWQFSF